MEWLFKKAEEFLRRHKFIRRWRKVLAVMMAMVVFMSTYAMVLPAITLETGEGAEIGLFADTSGDESVPDGSTVTDSIPEAGAEGAALATETAVIEDTAPAETAPVENVSTENAPAENTPAEPEAAETAPTEAAPTEAVPTEAAPTATETPAPQVEEVSATPEEPKYLDNEKLVFENNSIKLTLTVPAAAKVVKGASLDVREIGQPFANDGLDENGRKNEYLSYLAAAETALNLTAEEITYIEKNIVNTPAAELPWARFFAISIKNADGAIAPACALPVEITYKNTAEAAADGLKVMCLLPNGTMTMVGSETKVATAAQTPIALLSAADSNFDITSKFVDAGTLTFGTFAVQVSKVDAAIEKEKEEAAKAAAEAAKAEYAPTSDASAAESVESIPTDESAAESADESQEESLPADESLEESLPADESIDESLDESLPADESLDESLPEETEDESLAEEAEKAEDETEAEEESKADDKATKTLVTKGADYTVTMTYTADAKIPAGAILSAKEILPTAYNYKGYFNKAADALNLSDEQKANTRARFFDIKIMLGTSEVTPAVPVQVEITYNKPQENSAFTEMNAVHFGKEGPEVISAEATQADVATGEVNAVGFEAGSFSVYGVMYTVDFETVDGVKWSWPGEGSYSIASILAEIGVTDPATDVKLVRTVDEGGAENVLFLEEKEDGWYLTSEAAFRDTFVLSVAAGEKVYIITVTDASEVPANDGVKSLVTDASITGATTTWEDGVPKQVLYPDQTYEISVSFAEENAENGQFPMGGSFTYQLPTGLLVDGASSSGVIPITLTGGAHAGESVNLNYSVTNTGLVTFTWDQTTNPGAYQQLANALYAKFKLDIKCKYTDDSGQLDFGNGIVKDVKVKNNGTVSVNKNGKYDPKTNKVNYTVTVKSDGVTKNVVITDTVSGTALTYNKDAVASTDAQNKEVPSPSTLDNQKGFTMTIDQMNHGETVTVRYSADVNLNNLTKNSDGTWGTVTETKNKVVVQSKDNPDVEKEHSGKDFEHKISVSDISKSGTSPVEADESGHAIVTWTIDANTNPNVSMAGHTISDSIAGNSVTMTYGDKIHVVATRADGTVAYEDDIYWGQNGLTKAGDGKSWTWTVPNQQPHTEKLSYKITYTTDVDVSDKLINTTVKNNSESDIGGKDGGEAVVGPHGGALTARKKVIKTDKPNKRITWEVSFDVPANGLDSAQVIDSVPVYENGGQVVAVDNYIDGTVTVTPELEGDESYEVTSSIAADGKEQVVITFYKLVDEQKVTGLTGTGTARRIRVQFDTEIDEAWMQAAATDNNALSHTNTGRVLLNGQMIPVSATSRVDSKEPGMSKLNLKEGVFKHNGDYLPAFAYLVTLEGVTDDHFDENGQIVLYDTFNSNYLAYYATSEEDKTGDLQYVGRIMGAESYVPSDPIHNIKATSAETVVESPENGKLTITIDRETIPVDEHGNFYPYYYIYYYLTIKDKIALEKMADAIQTSSSGVYKLINTVTNEKFGTETATVDYDIDVVDKSIIKPDGKDGKQNDQVYYQNGNYMVDYQIEVNPKSLQLGDDEFLTLTDDYENIAVDYTTIKIQKEGADGQLHDVEDSDGVSWNRKGNRVTYTLQNGVHYVITYTARITGEGQVTYSNTAEYFGVKDWETHQQNVSSEGHGTAPHYGITVFKHVKGEGSAPLPGAVFDLYRYGEQGSADSWQNRPTASVDDHTGWTFVETLTTDADGSVNPTNELAKTTWYKLVETTAPTVNGQEYQKKDFAYVFWITDSGKADYQNYVFLNDDVVAIDNEPVIPEKVNLGVTKTWNDGGDLTKRKDITVRLYADGVPYDMWTDKSGNTLPKRDDTVKVLHLQDGGSTESYQWTNLQGGPSYSVVEDGVAGYTTTYSSRGTQVGGNINITNKYIPGKTFIHVEKKWDSSVAPEKRPDDITVQLKRKISPMAEIRIVNRNGALIDHTPVPVGSNVNISFTSKPLFKTAYGLYEGSLQFKTENYQQVPNGVPISSEENNGYVGGDANTPIVTNIPYENVGRDGLTLRLTYAYESSYDYGNTNLVEGSRVTVTTTSEGDGTFIEDVNFNNENHFYTINASTDWKIDIDRLIKEDDDGSYIYYIEEVGVNDNTETPDEAKFTVSYENNDGIEGGTGDESQDTITVTNAPKPGSLKVTKSVFGHDAKGTYSIAVKDANGHYRNQNGEDVGTQPVYVTFNKDDTKVWQNLPIGKYIVEEADASVTGYTWSVTGTDVEVEVPAGETVEAEVSNVYEEKPASGSIKLTKSVTVNGSVTSTDAADGEYTFTITGPDGATASVATVTMKVSGGVATQYKLNDAATFTALPADKYVVIPDLDLGDYVITESPVEGMAVSSITGGKAGTVDLANRQVTVTVTADEVVPAEATAEFVNDVKQFKFKKVWLDSNDANANSVDWVKPITVELYGRKASASDTHIGDYVVTFPAPSGAAYTAELKTETIGGKTYKSYEITFSKLSAEYDSFYVKEKGLDAYFTTYGTSAQGATAGQMSAGEGEYIINSLVTVELPSTGGPGTLLYSMLGMMLIAFAGTAYMILLRRRRASLKGGGNLR